MNGIQEFINALKEPTFRSQALYQFSLVKPGDWDAAAAWAQSFGYSFTGSELKQAASQYPGFFKDSGEVPGLGWNVSTLD
jgi:hypothetical protein